ncbi:MAG: NAD(P)H-hydrate dehydratase [Verrucomicrobiae bacterium]|nr:NAD(P)H-hydrate dehydratase [Verrucomicrobiae bacterium]
MKLVTAAQMQELDRAAIREHRAAQRALMERAGQAVAREAIAFFGPGKRNLLVLAGPGNNGGDAKIAARKLKTAGWKVRVHTFPRERTLPDFSAYDGVIDGLLGIGLSRPVEGRLKEMIEKLNASKRRVLAVDIPSGLDADTGKPRGAAVCADLTVTFGLPKLGMVQPGAAEHVGRIHVADIGFPPKRVAAIPSDLELITGAELRGAIKRRPRESFKNQFGHVLVVAGSEGYHGAAWMTAHGALAAGAGLVTLAVPRSIYAAVAPQCRQVMVHPIEDAGRGCFVPESVERVLDLLEGKSAAALGPGIGAAPETGRFLGSVLEALSAPAVLDADALNLLARDESLWKMRRSAWILTPHPGEMARLSGCKTADIQNGRLESARSLARERGCTVVLKGVQTVIASPGQPLWIHAGGTPALATGGTGDVLTGLISGLLPGISESLEAAKIGVFIHARAAQMAEPEPVVTGIRVEDLLVRVKDAMLELVL